MAASQLMVAAEQDGCKIFKAERLSPSFATSATLLRAMGWAGSKSSDAAPEWQAMSLRFRSRGPMVACPLEGLVGLWRAEGLAKSAYF
jgi:hypothetical protein